MTRKLGLIPRTLSPPDDGTDPTVPPDPKPNKVNDYLVNPANPGTTQPHHPRRFQPKTTTMGLVRLILMVTSKETEATE